MELHEAIMGRRSCRSYDRERQATETQIREIIEAGTWAPSGTNSQPWRFTVVMGDAKAEFIKIFRENIEVKKGDYDERQVGIFEWSCLSLEKASAVILVWDSKRTWTSPQSIGACIQTMMLKAYDMGLGTLWVAATHVAHEELKKRYGKEEMDLIAGVGVGYPSAKMIGKKGPPRLSVDEVAELLG
ncbi:nitroreductase [Candidatus Bathyarchaeota archaeon]|nr:nitroreductase [Candidatus Bathyarchaeota archaeon]